MTFFFRTVHIVMRGQQLAVDDDVNHGNTTADGVANDDGESTENINRSSHHIDTSEKS